MAIKNKSYWYRIWAEKTWGREKIIDIKVKREGIQTEWLEDKRTKKVSAT